VLTIAAAILVPFHLLAAFLSRDVATRSFINNALAPGGTRSSSGGSEILVVYGLLIFQSLAPFFLGGAIARLVSAWYAGGALTAGDALRASFRRTPALVGAWAVLLVPKAAGFACCYLTALVPITFFCVTAPAIVIEGLGPLAGPARSFRLVSRRFWPCLLVIAVASIAASVLSYALGLIPTLLASILPRPFDWLVQGVITAGVSLIVTTALVSVAVLLYLDLRIRTEGLDIELGATDAFARAA
jgi:hypothetical protein